MIAGLVRIDRRRDRQGRQIRDRPDRARLSRAACSDRSAPTTGSSPARPWRCRRPTRTTPSSSIIDRAPRNAQGLVEATAEVEILRPTNAANGNRRLLYDVVNRGSKRAILVFQRRPGRQRFLQGGRCRQRLPDEPRLHRGVQRLAGRPRPARRAGRPSRYRWCRTSPGVSREEFIFDHTHNPADGHASPIRRPTSIRPRRR